MKPEISTMLCIGLFTCMKFKIYFLSLIITLSCKKVDYSEPNQYAVPSSKIVIYTSDLTHQDWRFTFRKTIDPGGVKIPAELSYSSSTPECNSLPYGQVIRAPIGSYVLSIYPMGSNSNYYSHSINVRIDTANICYAIDVE